MMSSEGTEAAHGFTPGGVSAFRARSLSEDTVRVHPSPAPSMPGPMQLSPDTSQDSAGLRETAPADFLSQLMASQHLPGATETRAQGSGSVPAVQQGIPTGGLMANLSEPGALASLLQTGDCYGPQCLLSTAVQIHRSELAQATSFHVRSVAFPCFRLIPLCPPAHVVGGNC